MSNTCTDDRNVKHVINDFSHELKDKTLINWDKTPIVKLWSTDTQRGTKQYFYTEETVYVYSLPVYLCIELIDTNGISSWILFRGLVIL